VRDAPRHDVPLEWQGRALRFCAIACRARFLADPEGAAVERVTGIEPAFSAWEADVLPLNYTRDGGHRTARATAGSVPA
jgi:hypothetical protein